MIRVVLLMLVTMLLGLGMSPRASATSTQPAALAATDSYSVTSTGGGSGGTIVPTAKENGLVTSFRLNGRSWHWDPERKHYFPAGLPWLYQAYVFFPNGDGTYRYKKIETINGTTIETGEVKPN